MDVLTKIVELLSPIDSEERMRIISAALTLLGEKPVSALPVRENEEESAAEIENLSPRARVWMKQYSISSREIEEVFHISNGTAEIIAASIPGNNNKEKTFSVYILAGTANLLAKGESTFDDKMARDLCKSAGCYDPDNHASYMKNKGNEFAGSKDKGWTLTTPGLKRGAELIKELNK